MLVPITQAVNYIRDKYDIPKEWTQIVNLKGRKPRTYKDSEDKGLIIPEQSRPPVMKKPYKTDIRAYISHLGDKGVVGIEVNKNGTILYESDDLDAVFLNWNKSVSVSYSDVKNDLLIKAKTYIKETLLQGFDIGVIKYNLNSDGLFKVYKNRELKVMNSKGEFVD
tara:strand:+ start:18 stop:515 length:498 start_codon:yes stop_codon:yes gene_type:complete